MGAFWEGPPGGRQKGVVLVGMEKKESMPKKKKKTKRCKEPVPVPKLDASARRGRAKIQFLTEVVWEMGGE